MDSLDSPCSGFVAVNDDNQVCAGFRQCSSTKGVTGLNPSAHAWDVPMEVRCATNDNLTTWGPPQWIYDVYVNGLGMMMLPTVYCTPWTRNGVRQWCINGQ